MENKSSSPGKFLFTWVLLMLVWYAFTLSLQPAEIIAGLIVTFIVSWLNYNSFTCCGLKLLHPGKLWLIVQYLYVFLVALVKSNFHVAAIVISPTINVNPGIVKFKTNLKSDFAKMVLANSITLTPGTLSVDVIEDEFYIHWLEVTEYTEAGIFQSIAADFENKLVKIFDK
jgi:multicomponent Na+:H+ antiporter subunit E